MAAILIRMTGYSSLTWLVVCDRYLFEQCLAKHQNATLGRSSHFIHFRSLVRR
jgi:hypothetical protein